MTLMRYTPRSTFASWPELDLFSNRMSRILGDSWDSPEATGSWIPAVNVEETAAELLLTAERPGMNKKDINLNLKNNILTIHGEKREEREEGGEGHKYRVWERRYGGFHRAFTLPWTVQADGILEDFDSGVFTVRLPKAPEAKGHNIRIVKKK
jgi:HSP20 family protein